MCIRDRDGIAAYGAVMYVNFVFSAIFIGYSIGAAPVIGYHYGAQNHAELKNLFRRSLVLVVISGVAMTVLAELLAQPLTHVFVGYDAGLYALTVRGFMLYSISFLVSGVNIFGSAFFTALNNGLVSAAISFLRTLVFQVAVVLLLPLLLGIDGIWLAIVAAELLALAVTLVFLSLIHIFHCLSGFSCRSLKRRACSSLSICIQNLSTIQPLLAQLSSMLLISA